MRSQPHFHTGKIQKGLFLAFEIVSNIKICNLNPLFVQQLMKNFHLAVQFFMAI